jgi:hypothetical protein
VHGEMAAYFRDKWIVHQTMARYFSEQNGVPERLNWVHGAGTGDAHCVAIARRDVGGSRGDSVTIVLG